MAVLTVTVYKINSQYFPEGCEKQIACGKVLSLKENVPLYLPNPPLTCDEDQPEPVITEVIKLPGGDIWWIEQGSPSFVLQCNAATPSAEQDYTFATVEATENFSYAVPDGWMLDVISWINSGGANEILRFGKTPGADDIWSDTVAEPNKWDALNTNVFENEIYVSNVTQPTTFNFFIRKNPQS